MYPKIAVIHYCHLASERFPAKVMKRLGGVTLLDIALSKVKNVDQFVCHPLEDKIFYDEEAAPNCGHFACKCEGRIFPELFTEIADQFSDYDWIVDANFICHPFLRRVVIEAILFCCTKLTFSFTFAQEVRNVIWNEDRNIISGVNQLADTKNNPLCLMPAHIAYCYKYKDALLSEDKLANRIIPIPFDFHPLDLFDIDTPADFEVAKYIYYGMEREYQ